MGVDDVLTVNGQRFVLSVCYRCVGSGLVSTENKRIKCDVCNGDEKIRYCWTCGKALPCGGKPTERGGSDCLRAGRSDKRTGTEIRDLALSDVSAMIGRWFNMDPPKPGEVLDVLEQKFQMLAEQARKRDA